ncbi:MAG: response regulator [Chitinispirillaceae bacterium]|nr:response regulator [Chitinispirillaceae bacterium]
MTKIREQAHFLTDIFKKSINLLVVEDYAVMGNVIVELFSSPLFKSTLASSAEQAREIIAKTTRWHCWVLDIAMEEEESGLKLLSEHPQFPFVVMLSGIRSMNIASRAMQLGAFKVFDKDPHLLPALRKEVCTLAALAYILQGAGTKYFSLFYHLAQSAIDSTETWANKACLTVRQLERICSLHSHLTPRFIPSLFYTLELLLQCDADAAIPASLKNDLPLRQHVEFVVKHIETIVKT